MVIASIQKAMTILTALAENKNKPLSLKSISEKTGIKKSTCSHILSTLSQDGFAVRISHSKGYILGPAAYCLSNYSRYDDDFIALAHPILEWLHRKTEFAVAIAKIQGSHKYIIDYIDPTKKIYLQEANIREDDIYRTSSGRLLLSHMDSQSIAEIINKIGLPKSNHWPEVKSIDDLYYQLSKINKHGVLSVANDDKTSQNLCIGYSAAIYRYSICVAAIGCAVIVPREKLKDFQLKNESKLKEQILIAANEISRRLRFT